MGRRFSEYSNMVTLRVTRHKRATCEACINVNTARALCLLSCRTRQKNLPPTASQIHWKQNVTHFRRDEGRVKSLKNQFPPPALFFGTVILFRGYTGKTPLNYPLLRSRPWGAVCFCRFLHQAPSPASRCTHLNSRHVGWALS